MTSPQAPQLLPDRLDDLGRDGPPLESEHRLRVAGELPVKKPSGTYAKRYG